MTIEHAGFVGAVIESPGDDATRLIYADWLEEHGEQKRAEFIRAQVEWTHIPGHDEACPYKDGHGIAPSLCRKCKLNGKAAYLLEHELPFKKGAPPRWFVSLSKPPAGWAGDYGADAWITLSRGFYSHIACPLTAFLTYGPQIAVVNPVEVVQLTDREPEHIDERYWWYYDDGIKFRLSECGRDHYSLPVEWFNGPVAVSFDTAQAAHAWASARAIRWARTKGKERAL